MSSERVEWYDRRRTWWDVLRCALGLHRTALNSRIDGHLVQRCTCGAFGPWPWFYLSRSEAREKWRRRSDLRAVARAARRVAQIPDEDLQAEIQRVGAELKAEIAEIRQQWQAAAAEAAQMPHAAATTAVEPLSGLGEGEPLDTTGGQG